MRKIREMLRLKSEAKLSARQIAISVQAGRATIGDYLNRLTASGLTWARSLVDAELEHQYNHQPRQYPANSGPCPTGPRYMPSCVAPA